MDSRGLAQKLAIRLGNYPQSKLIEINAHALGSKFFGESAKLVNNLFNGIESGLEEEEDTFFCVFVDEIETLAAKREHMLGRNEPFDAIRAVNALLTGLDRLRHYPNVIFLCTSNLVSALDPAFIDRVDIKQFMPHLSTRVIYEIFKDCLEELSRVGIVEGVAFDVIPLNSDDPQTQLRYVEELVQSLALPPFEEVILNYQMFPEAIPAKLAELAGLSKVSSAHTEMDNLSGVHLTH